MGLFDVGHVAKLHEIQAARLRASQEGIGSEVEELIRRLEMGGVNQWRIQAMRLWDRGFGCDPSVQAKDFDAYLAGIPQIPAGLLADDPDLPLLSLADPRPGLLRACCLLGIQLGHSEGSIEPFDLKFPLPSEPFWFRHDDGRKNRNRCPNHCRDELVGDIQVGTAMEGVFAYAHYPQIVVEGEHSLDLPRTVNSSWHVYCASLGVWRGQTGFGFNRHTGVTDPDRGSLRVRRK